MPQAAIIIPLLTAAAGVGAAVYTANKAEDAAKDAAATDNMRRTEAMTLDQQKQTAELDRNREQASSRELANQSAENMQMSGMENAAEDEKRRLEQEKLLAQKNPDLDYAAKFSPGQGGDGTDSSSDFLVPKLVDDAGLIRDSTDTGGGGLITPLTFNV